MSTTVNNPSLDGKIFIINNGDRSGNNLFHSFDKFSIPTNGSAVFNNAAGIQNIFGWVTGGTISNIDGLIEAQGTANLFLLNPSGVIFGPNASLNLSGSFITSTADSIIFQDNIKFSAIDKTTPPLLTMSVPVGLELGANPGATITVTGNGNNLKLQRYSSLNTSIRPQGLHNQKVTNQTLALVGNNLVLDGGNITLPKGRLELWSVNNGQVSLVNNNGQLQLEPLQGINYSNIDLQKAASVDISGNNTAVAQIRGKEINLKQRSVILAETKNNGLGGILNLQASEFLTVEGFALNQNIQVFSGILADVAPNENGQGGNIFINTKNLFVKDGGQISTGTFGQGNAGNLTIKAQDVEVTGTVVVPNRGTFATLLSANARETTGNAGTLTIEANSLKVKDGAQIPATTSSQGNAGKIVVTAKDIELSNSGSGLFSFTTPGAKGVGGDLQITTDSLKISHGAAIVSTTSSSEKAGNIKIDATQSV
ncbi:Putative hemagglutinin-related protein [Richelia intracellularis]|nr:Putative hemagglutinin-related protein [Richelia intracellularis]